MNLLFLKSFLDKRNHLVTLDHAVKWIKQQNEAVQVNVSQIPFSKLKKWTLDDFSLHHDSGSFFSIQGIDVNTNYGLVANWQQPIISQPEIGYLGFITKEINGVLHFLMQAKVEPGNVNYVQLSPTLQATKSNYTQVHQGNPPAYLSYFQNARKEQILLDQLQSEQGARFLKKRNRNIIIKVEKEIEVKDNFLWLTLYQIKELLKLDNIVNMDTRTVISGIPLSNFSSDSVDVLEGLGYLDANLFYSTLLKSAASNNSSYNTITDIINFITNLKSSLELEVKNVPISKLDHWVIDDDRIFHEDEKYFEIIAADIEIDNREVINWSQPLVKPVQSGICAFVCKSINGVLHFAVQAKLECGNFDLIELAPTVQCLTDNYNNSNSIEELPFLKYVLNAKKEAIISDTLQSEEGGRFYQEQNRNLIVFANEDISLELPPNFIWMTFSQLQTFIKFNNYINIQARSLLASLSFI